jgi:ATP-dependent protease ClpP protease subunit
MSKIYLRGTIVSASYDVDWLANYIERGVITPESRLRRDIAAANRTEPLDLHIHSPGGSIFAANEMYAALTAWKKETGQTIKVSIGGMAASAAANLVLMLAPDTVAVTPLTKIMFHGASTETWGGQGAHTDSADLLASINNDVKSAIVSRLKFPAAEVETWFAEGRMKWLNATEALACGLATEITAAAPEPAKKNPLSSSLRAASALLTEGGFAIAASAVENALAELPDEPDAMATVTAQLTDLTARLDAAETAKLALAADLATAQATATAAETAKTALSADLATTRAALAKLTPASGAPEGDAHATGPANHRTAIAQIIEETPGITSAAANLAAVKRWPHLRNKIR